jgi:hypothetical protein
MDMKKLQLLTGFVVAQASTHFNIDLSGKALDAFDNDFDFF